MFKYLFLFFLLFESSKCDIEDNIREEIFDGYDKFTRPVKEYNKSVNLYYLLELKELQLFDQKNEKITINIVLTQMWNDEYLSWNHSKYPVDYINVNSEDIWRPDLEIYNSATKPSVLSDLGSVKLEHTGYITWIRTMIISFSCPLELHQFPFDEQKCSILFGSWKLSKAYLDIIPVNIIQLGNLINLDNIEWYKFYVSEDYKHNEWNIIDVNVNHEDREYLCCPGEFWPNTEISFIFSRNYNTYLVGIIMVSILTFVAMLMNQINPSNYIRGYILVFLPLSIIWIELNLANKIPVISYGTKLENYYLICFSIIVGMCMYSGLLHRIIVNYFPEETDKKYVINNLKEKTEKKKNRKLEILEKIDLYISKIVLFAWILIMSIYFI